jgi:hypothetical protein
MKSKANLCSRALGGNRIKRHPHSFGRGVRSRADNSVLEEDVKSHDNKATPSSVYHSTASDITLSSQPPSHGMDGIEVTHCYEPLPSISEVVAVIDEILHSMRAQRKGLRIMAHGESPTTFHHILPVWSFRYLSCKRSH